MKILTKEQTDDGQLIEQVLKGNEDAFAEIVNRYSTRIFQIASRYFRQRSQVEEIAQEVFIKAYTQLANFAGRGSFEGWLSRITTSICLNTIRSAKRHPESTVTDLSDDEYQWLENYAGEDSRQGSFEASLIAADLAERVLQTLPPDDRLVLTLLEGEELSVKEIAELTGWSEAKVKVQAFRARQRMREAVEKLLTGKEKTLQGR